MCASKKTIVKISQSAGSAKRRRSEMNLSIYGGSLSDAQAASRFRSGPRVHRCAMGKAKARAAPLGLTNGKTLSVSEIHLSRRTCDAAMIHVHNRKTIAVRLKTLAATGNKAELIQNKAADCLVRTILGQLDVVFAFEFADIGGTVKDHRAIGERERTLDHVELIVNLAHHLLENIFERGEAENAAEFINDHGEAGAARAEFEEEFAGALRFRNDEDVAQHRAQIEVGR